MNSGSPYPGLRYQPSSDHRGPIFRAARGFLRRQFGRPVGLFGDVVGHIMAAASSNNDRIRWTVSLLGIRPTDRVLEIGFGPGVAIAFVSTLVPNGLVAGVDHSAVMVRQASRRNAAGVRDGRISLRQGSVESLPDFDAPFDKIFTINSIHFWREPIHCLRQLRRHLKSGGVLAVTYQPRSRGATDEAAAAIGKELVQDLREAGFVRSRLETKAAQPVSIVCALGTQPDIQ
jgi:SAM-dependent methyltransferase